jgi:hypothetical protein
MSINSEIVALERRQEDLEHAVSVHRNERTGQEGPLLEELAAIPGRLRVLRQLAEPPEGPVNKMPPCAGCGRAFWPESLVDGRCESCQPEKKPKKK